LLGGDWLPETQTVVVTAAALLGAALCSRLFLGPVQADVWGAIACAAASIYSLREITSRLGEHRVVRTLRRTPGVSVLLSGVGEWRS
jgi:hypothetical protein